MNHARFFDAHGRKSENIMKNIREWKVKSMELA